MATGSEAFRGQTSAVIFNAIFNSDPAPASSLNLELPQALDGIIGKALEKDRDLRYQSANELRADLKRLKRDLDSGQAQPLRGERLACRACGCRPGALAKFRGGTLFRESQQR